MVSYTLLSSGGDRDACKATLLDFDGEIRVLADPGWNGDHPDDVLFLERYLGEVDFIVLSHSTPEFIGAYVLLCVKFPMLMRAIPVYATVAVGQLARVSTVEFYRARGILGPVNTSILEVSDVDECLDRIVSIKYQQNMPMLENKIVLTAYNAGHTLGGAFWLFTKRMEKVVYAPTWNHSRDSFLNSAGFLSASTGAPVPSLVRPTTLITSSDLGSQMSHKNRTDKFLQLVDATLANGGAVLLPVAVSGRFLELLRIIDDHLSNLSGAAIPVYFLSYSGTKVLSYAANLVDWMSSQLAQQHAKSASDIKAYVDAPFEPSKVDLLSDPTELLQLPGPKIVFASGLDFASGDLSSQALQWLCQEEKSTLILTEKSSFAANDTLTATLYEEWHRLAAEKNGGNAEDGIPVPLEKTVAMDAWVTEEDLLGNELATFKERISSARRHKLLEKVRDKKNANILNADSDDSSSSDEGSSDEEINDKPELGAQITSTSLSGAPTQVEPTADALKTHEAFVSDYISEQLAAHKPIDIRITSKMKPKQAMFPFEAPPKKRKFDDYGEVIDIKNFSPADDHNANSKLISESKRKFELNEKGKWGDRNDRRRGGRRGDRSEKLTPKGNKLTPQEVLNKELLRKNLDSLFKPVRRVLLRDSIPHQQLQLKLRCGLSFVDLAGRVDLRSLVMIVSVLRPQSVVLLPDFSCSAKSNDSLDGRKLLVAAFDKQKSEQKSKIASDSLLASSRFGALTSSHRAMAKAYSNETKVYVVKPNEATLVGGDGTGKVREFEVKIDETLDKSLKWQKLSGNYRITHVRGELSIYQSQLLLKQRLADPSALSSQFILRPISDDALKRVENTSSLLEKTPGLSSSLAIGNVRLPELKNRLVALDLQAEFKGEGLLVVNDEIAVKKVAMGTFQGDDAGDLVIDGQIGPLYYKVKKCISEMLAYV